MGQNRLKRVARPWFLWWLFPTVEVATGKYWDRRESYIKTNHPILYQVQMQLPRKVRKFMRNSKVGEFLRSAKYHLGQIKWWFLFRTIHRYHVIKTGLKPDFYEIDTRMLHGCFTLLQEHAEGETRLKGRAALEKLSEWVVEVDGAEMFEEQRALLYWWMIERPTRFTPYAMDIPDEMAQNTKEFYMDQDDEMFNRLVNFRKKLY